MVGSLGRAVCDRGRGLVHAGQEAPGAGRSDRGRESGRGRLLERHDLPREPGPRGLPRGRGPPRAGRRTPRPFAFPLRAADQGHDGLGRSRPHRVPPGGAAAGWPDLLCEPRTDPAAARRKDAARAIRFRVLHHAPVLRRRSGGAAGRRRHRRQAAGAQRPAGDRRRRGGPRGREGAAGVARRPRAGRRLGPRGEPPRPRLHGERDRARGGSLRPPAELGRRPHRGRPQGGAGDRRAGARHVHRGPSARGRGPGAARRAALHRPPEAGSEPEGPRSHRRPRRPALRGRRQPPRGLQHEGLARRADGAGRSGRA